MGALAGAPHPPIGGCEHETRLSVAEVRNGSNPAVSGFLHRRKIATRHVSPTPHSKKKGGEISIQRRVAIFSLAHCSRPIVSWYGLGGRVMFGSLRGFVIAAAFALPTAAAAQLQVNQNFVTQGPAPSFGPLDHGSERRCAPEWKRCRRGGAGGGRSRWMPNTLFVGTPAGGIWKTTNGGTTWTPLTDKQASLSIASLALIPTDSSHNTLIAGTGLTANGTVCSAGALLLYRFRRPAERTLVLAGWR